MFGQNHHKACRGLRCRNPRRAGLVRVAVSLVLLCHAGGSWSAATVDAKQAVPPLRPGGFHVDVDGDRVTVMARDALIEAVLEDFTRQHGLSLLVDRPLQGTITVNVQDASAPAALHRMLNGRDFALLIEPSGGWREGGGDAAGVRPRGKLWIFPKAGGHETEPAAGSIVGGKSGTRVTRNDGATTAGKVAPDGRTPGTGDTVEDLQSALSHDDPAVRADAVARLWEIGGDEAAAVLMNGLSDADPWIRQETAYAIGADGGVNSITALKQFLQDTDVHVRQAAVEALANTHEPASARVLADALHDPDSSVRAQAVQVLGDLGGDAATRALDEALDDPDHEVRREAIFALYRAGGSAAVEMLKKSVNDGSPAVRRETVKVLGAIGSDDVEQLLRQALDDPDASVQAAARAMLGNDEALVR